MNKRQIFCTDVCFTYTFAAALFFLHNEKMDKNLNKNKNIFEKNKIGKIIYKNG